MTRKPREEDNLALDKLINDPLCDYGRDKPDDEDDFDLDEFEDDLLDDDDDDILDDDELGDDDDDDDDEFSYDDDDEE